MKVLWLCNVMPSLFSSSTRITHPNSGGWLTGALNAISNTNNLEMFVLFPLPKIKKEHSGKINNVSFSAFKLNSRSNQLFFTKILQNFSPDIIHIWGTEMSHATDMVLACQQLGMTNKILVNVQGLVSVIAQHLFSGLPTYVIHSWTLREVLLRENTYFMKKSFEKRGKKEISIFKNIQHVIGRTNWDRACVLQMNPNLTYHFCNETLRDSFYEKKWEYDTCQKHSIFISQASYPIKGFHFVLRALPAILSKFPDTHVYISGTDPTRSVGGMYERIKITSYGVYIKNQIASLSLQNKISFLGSLNETSMCKRYLASNIFVSASTVENESNSVSEAKLLGMPIIASFVGGVTNRIEHNITGLFYQHDAPYMLAYWIIDLFSNPEKAIQLGEAAHQSAIETHSKEKNKRMLLDIYNSIDTQNNKYSK